MAAAEAEDLEAKRGRRKFSLLQKGSSKHSKIKQKGKERTEQAQSEQQHHVRGRHSCSGVHATAEGKMYEKSV